MTQETPRPYDAVLGGSPTDISTTLRVPTATAVLGGIQGVINDLQNGSQSVKIQALQKALNYGEEGLNIVIETLENASPKLKVTAYNLLKNRTEEQVLKALENFNPFHFFECLKTLEGHSEDVYSVSVTNDCKYIIAGIWEHTIKVWGIPE